MYCSEDRLKGAVLLIPAPCVRDFGRVAGSEAQSQLAAVLTLTSARCHGALFRRQLGPHLGLWGCYKSCVFVFRSQLLSDGDLV